MTKKESNEGAQIQDNPPVVDWENIAKYKAAELENYIKRQKDSVQNAFNDGRANVIVNVLPVFDSFAEALKTVKNENDKAGIEVLQRKFESILLGMGLEAIPAKAGDTFDPYIHNCVQAEEGTDNLIKEIWQKGYKFQGRVLRPVTVKI